MKKIIEQMASAAGITPEQAETAYTTVIDNLKVKLPSSVSSQIDDVLEDKEFDFKSVFKERFDSMKDETGDQMSAFADEMNERFQDLGQKAEDKFGDLKEDAQGFFKKLFK